MKNCDLNDYLSLTPHIALNLTPMYQLTSLTMKNHVINMNKMISILSNTSSLTYLQLTGIIDQIDFQWEQLIQTKLPLLNQFKFSFYTRFNDNIDLVSADRLITFYRTPF